MESRRRVGQTLIALLRPVGGSMVLSVGGLWASRHVVSASVLAASNDVVGNYLQTLGSIYAVLLAFVVYVVWSQFNEARSHVEHEANELLDLRRTADGLPGSTPTRVHELVRAYAAHVIDEEWISLGCEGPAGLGVAAPILDELWSALHDVEALDDADRPILQEALQRLDDLSDARSSRLASSRTKIPQALRILLYAGAVSLVASMYLFAVASFALHAAITAALAGAISHVLFVIEDLDHCFHGHWQVSRAPFERALAQFEAMNGTSRVHGVKAPPKAVPRAAKPQ